MWSITLKMMRKNVKMLVPAGIAIVLGAAFIASTFLFGNSLNDSLHKQITAKMGQANYVVTIDHKLVSSGKALKLKDLKLDQMKRIEGVKGVHPSFHDFMFDVSGNDKHASVPIIPTSDDANLLPVKLVTGHLPSINGQFQIALPKPVAKNLGASIGKKVDVTILSGAPDAATISAQVVGLTEDPAKVYAEYNGASLLSTRTLAHLLGLESLDDLLSDSILLDIDQSQADTSTKAIQQLLPSGYMVVSRQTAGDEALKSATGSQTNILTIFLLTFGILAMLVASLVIANTFQVLVAQRRRTFALLRTIGAKKGQLYQSVLVEAGTLGLVSSLFGLLVSMGVMALALRSGLIPDFAVDTSLVITWPVIAVPLAFGTAVTVMASLGSARLATKVTPLEALQPLDTVSSKRAGFLRALLGAALVTAGIASSTVAVRWLRQILKDQLTTNNSDSGYSTALFLSVAGCGLVFVGLILTAVFWMPLLMKGMGALIAVAGPSAKISTANIQRNPRRVASTGVALLIGVTLVACIATGAASAKQTMGKELDSRYSVDLVALGGTLSQKQADKISKLANVSKTLYAPAATMLKKEADGYRVFTVVGVSGSRQLQAVMKVNLHGIDISGDKALIPKYGVGSGGRMKYDKSSLTLIVPDSSSTQTGYDATEGQSSGSQNSPAKSSLTFQVQPVDYSQVTPDGSTAVFVDEAYFTRGDLKAQQHILLAKFDGQASDSSVADTMIKIQSITGDTSGTNVAGPVAMRISIEKTVDLLMNLLIGLLAIAVLVALIGVANTLSLSVLERTRESATLRAIGMTKGQLRRSLGIEALLIALVSGLAGIVVGTVFGWLGSYMVFSTIGDTVFPIDWRMDTLMLLVAGFAALLASVLPARHAARTPPVEALAEA